MIYHTVYATKIGKTILLNEDGSPIYVVYNDFYENGLSGYWLLSGGKNQYQIIRYHSSKSFDDKGNLIVEKSEG